MRRWQTVDDLSQLKRDEKFRKIFEIAWDIDWLIQGGSSGIGPFASLIGVRGEHIVYFLLGDAFSMKQKPDWVAYLLSELYTKSGVSWIKKAAFALIYS